MKSENKEIFIPGPCGRIQAKYFKNKQQVSPVAIVLQPHPQYGGSMNNRIVYETYNSFYKNSYSFHKLFSCSSCHHIEDVVVILMQQGLLVVCF